MLMTRKVIFAILFIIYYSEIFSQRITSREEYINTYRELAIEEMQRTGIPASIKLAQACLESGNGNSELSKRSNNHFGIKCKSNWSGRKVYYDDDEPGECFRAYRSVEESYIDHSNFLVSNPRYGSLFALDITDYKGWAHGLKKAGYATNPNYAHSLIRIIEEHRLYNYDHLSSADLKRLGRFRNQGVASGPVGLINSGKHVIAMYNNRNTITVKAGESIKSIARELDIPARHLYRYNDFPRKRAPKINEILYIEKKARRAPKGVETHVVAPGETMHYISQLYGLQIKPLRKRNNLGKYEEPQPGTVIYLRKKAR